MDRFQRIIAYHTCYRGDNEDGGWPPKPTHLLTVKVGSRNFLEDQPGQEWGLNPGPFACQINALPLSYTPVRV